MAGSTYAFRIDTSAFDDFSQTMRTVGQTSAEAQQAFNTLIGSSPQLATALQKAADASKQVVDANRAMSTAAANDTGLPTMAKNVDRVATSHMNLRNVLQNSGYQVQDFLTQVSSGQSALVAFGQQFGQLAGAFGPTGAVVGIAATVGVMAAQFLTAGDNAKALQKSGEDAFKGIAESAKVTAEVVKKVDDLFRTSAENAQAARDATIASLRETVTQQLSVATMRQEDSAMELSKRQQEVQVLERRLAIEQQIADQSRRAGGPVPVDQTSAAESQLWTARNAVQGESAFMNSQTGMVGKLQDQLKRLSEAPAAAPKDPSKSAASQPGDPMDALEKLQQQVDKAARGIADSVDPAQKAFDTLIDGLNKLRAAGDLYAATQDREGGPLGLSPERVQQLTDSLNDQFSTNITKAVKETDNLAEAGRGVGQVFTSTFDRMVTGGAKAKDAITALENGIAKLLERLFITQPLEKALTGLNLPGLAGNLFGSVFGYGADQVPANQLGLSSVDEMMAALPARPAAPSSLFADGGIMTSGGRVPLRTYAGGGIANSPQAAIFGEGSMPEAYVPLPDGNRIPVRMQGGGGHTYVIDARGAEQGVEGRIDAVIARRLPDIAKITNASLVQDVNRGGITALRMGRR